MAIDSPKKPFSKRYGYRSQPKEITVWEEAPEALRHFILDTGRELEFGPHPLREAICSVLDIPFTQLAPTGSGVSLADLTIDS